MFLKPVAIAVFVLAAATAPYARDFDSFVHKPDDLRPWTHQYADAAANLDLCGRPYEHIRDMVLQAASGRPYLDMTGLDAALDAMFLEQRAKYAAHRQALTAGSACDTGQLATALQRFDEWYAGLEEDLAKRNDAQALLHREHLNFNAEDHFKALAAAGEQRNVPPPAPVWSDRQAPAGHWHYFDPPVEVLAQWERRSGEGSVTSGLSLSDAYGTYDLICINDSGSGAILPGRYFSRADGYGEDIDGTPSLYLADARGYSFNKLQWAEACTRLGLLRD